MASSPEESGLESPVEIRTAVPFDLHGILEIERLSATSAHWSPADYEAALSHTAPPRVFLVAALERRVRGFLVARSANSSEWDIENVVVAETARRAGVGSLLVQTFLEHVRCRKSVHESVAIGLEVRESNLGARRFYEKSGFLLDTRRRAYYRDPKEDALLYALCLQ